LFSMGITHLQPEKHPPDKKTLFVYEYLSTSETPAPGKGGKDRQGPLQTPSAFSQNRKQLK
jgi:hypothetical protein